VRPSSLKPGGPDLPAHCPCAPRQAPPGAFLDLDAVVTAPGRARAWIRQILGEWGISELADTAELVVSELVTNSVRACAGLDRPAIRLIVTAHQVGLAVLVRDGHPGLPQSAPPGPGDEGGRGLLIVRHLSARWGWYRLEGARPAKVTWSVIARPGRGVRPDGAR
jgi:anti-sigma regulatory factor (Ser/Thr protein kinase)